MYKRLDDIALYILNVLAYFYDEFYLCIINPWDMYKLLVNYSFEYDVLMINIVYKTLCLN